MMNFGLSGKIVDVETAFLYGYLEHIDVRTKFVKEFCEDGIIKIIFVRLEDSDILTKNLQSELFGKYSRKLIKGK